MIVPEEYDQWYDYKENHEILDALFVYGDLARFNELLSQVDEDDRLDMFSDLILHSRRKRLSSKEVLLAGILLLEGIKKPSPYLNVIIDAVEDGPPEDYLLPMLKYAKRLILPNTKLVSLRYVTIPIVRELLNHVEIEPDTIDRFRTNNEVLSYLRDMGKISEKIWRLYYKPIPELHGQKKILSLVERYL